MSASVLPPNSDEQSVIAKKLAKKDPTLKDLMDVLRVIKSDGSQHDKKLDNLNRLFSALCAKYKELLETVSRQEETITDLKAKLIHTSNDYLEAKNIGRLSSVIFTGISSHPSSKSIDVMKEVKDVMEILEISQFEVKNYQIIPWGSSYAMKCTFSHASTCGLILRYSYKLGKGAIRKYNVRPDLSPEQRTVRNKLCSLRQEMESSSNHAKCALKSWRYLAVSQSSGSIVYYEADYTSPPQLIDATLIPVKMRTQPTWKSQPDQSHSRTQPQRSNPQSSNSIMASSYNELQHIYPTVSTNKLKKTTLTGDSTIDIDTSLISVSL